MSLLAHKLNTIKKSKTCFKHEKLNFICNINKFTRTKNLKTLKSQINWIFFNPSLT